MGSPSREDDRLSSLPRLPGDAGHMREVGAPLPAVQPVLPELSHLDALHNRVIDYGPLNMVPCQFGIIRCLRLDVGSADRIPSSSQNCPTTPEQQYNYAAMYTEDVWRCAIRSMLEVCSSRDSIARMYQAAGVCFRWNRAKMVARDSDHDAA